MKPERSIPKLHPVSATTLSGEVARQLRELINSGDLHPGDRIPSERELADRLGVGRPAVREALRELKAHGLVATSRGRGGTVVTDRAASHRLASTLGDALQPGAESLVDLMTYRRAIEGEAAALAARGADLEDVRRLARTIPRDEGPLLPEEDTAFHTAVGRASANLFLQRAIIECTRLLHEQAPAMFSAIYAEPGGPATVRRQHDAIYQAIRHGDELGARQAMTEHVDYVARLLAQLMGTAPPIKIVVCDLDGTLLSGPRHISERTRAVLAEVRDLGIQVILASARPPRSMRRYHDVLALTTPVIACNGALLWDLHAGIPLARLSLDRNLARELMRLGRSLGAIVNLESDDEWFIDRITEGLTENLRRFGAAPPDAVGVVDDMLERGEPVDKVFLDVRDLPPEERAAALETLTGFLKGRANVSETVPGLLDVVSPEASKAAMAQRLARTSGVAADQVFAIGDHDNDVALLRWAGVGVAMGNATPEAKAAADAISSSNQRDGVAEALERWVLGDYRSHPTPGSRSH